MTIRTYLTSWGLMNLLAFFSAVVNAVGVAKKKKYIVYVFKPLTLLLLIWIAWQLKRGPHSATLRTWFLPALLFSFLGDVFLMFAGNISFLLGLVSFFAAHVCYIIGLNPTLPPPGTWFIFVLMVVLFAVVYPKIRRGLLEKGESPLQIPTAIYAMILSAMLGSAWATLIRPEWMASARVVLIAGGSLFYLSDFLLAWNRFVTYTHTRDILVIVTYHLAQIFLTASIAMGPNIL